ncbi:ABC-type glycerol-3-phosphate transport system substrate-binding protein [Microbacterium sp. SORGH_AS428]|uniref:ABC transporter substrate-binding protein n=1 Tax=Microbacterium sp. SORGH_AS_0428 TaxID=3041788 RepID=UPI00285E4BBC|nr:sugar ABC transporter substrate-binding protein [Microbacterium sp. SORGH_AS_0428]MDR6199151.1 ABC-type glycerol-3-phosphate transport system substrate-binding protein [Microbacterium sp. SORGH_AS_0428]
MSASSRRILRRLAVPATLAVTALALASCAGGSAAADGGDKELTVLLISSHEGASKLLAERYEAETGIKINPVIVPYDEIGNTLALDQQSGANTIDVAAPWYVSIGDLADAGAIQDLTDWIDSDADLKTDDFIPSIYDPYSLVDGRRYGLPFDGDTHVLFYNKEILARNGFTQPPATWDEYIEQSRAITANESANGVYGNVIFGQKSPLILGASFANRLAGFGGEFVDADGKPVINSLEAIAAAQSLADALPSAYPTPAETAFGEGNSAWYAGHAAFIENWTDLGVGSETNPDSTVKGEWGVTLLPVGGDNTTSRGLPRRGLHVGGRREHPEDGSRTRLHRLGVFQRHQQGAPRRGSPDGHRSQPDLLARERGVRHRIPRPAAREPRHARRRARLADRKERHAGRGGAHGRAGQAGRGRGHRQGSPRRHPGGVGRAPWLTLSRPRARAASLGVRRGRTARSWHPAF